MRSDHSHVVGFSSLAVENSLHLDELAWADSKAVISQRLARGILLGDDGFAGWLLGGGEVAAVANVAPSDELTSCMLKLVPSFK